jgi:hypothetical protein
MGMPISASSFGANPSKSILMISVVRQSRQLLGYDRGLICAQPPNLIIVVQLSGNGSRSSNSAIA